MTPPCGWALASLRATACGRPLGRLASTAGQAQGLRPVHRAGYGAVRRDGGRSRHLRRACPLARWSGLGPRHEAPVPGPCPAPSRCLDLGVSAPLRLWAVVAEGVFDWLALASWGVPAVSALGTQGVERVASGPPWLPPRLPRLRQRRGGPWGDGGACGLAWQAGRRRHPSPGRRRRGRACCPSPGPGRLPPPACTGGPLRPVAPATPPSRLSPNGASPLRLLAGLAPASSPHHSHRPGGPMPISRRATPAHGFP